MGYNGGKLSEISLLIVLTNSKHPRIFLCHSSMTYSLYPSGIWANFCDGLCSHNKHGKVFFFHGLYILLKLKPF